jgi:hypothetical protein
LVGSPEYRSLASFSLTHAQGCDMVTEFCIWRENK